MAKKGRGRSTHEGLTYTPQRYGSPPWVGEVLPEWFNGKLWLRHAFRNYLVAVHKRYEKQRHAAYLRFPEFELAQAMVDACLKMQADLRDEAKTTRKNSMTTVPNPDNAAMLEAAKHATKAARAWLKAVKAEPFLKEAVTAILDEDGHTAAWNCARGKCFSTRTCGKPRPRGEMKGSIRDCGPGCHHRCPYPTMPSAYSLWANGLDPKADCPDAWLADMRDLLNLKDDDGEPLPVEDVRKRIAEMLGDGLNWATVSDVMHNFDVSGDQIREKRNNGKPAGLQFHHWDGTGTLVVQVQAGRTQWEIVEGREPREWRVVGTCEACGRAVSRFAPQGRDAVEAVCPRAGCGRSLTLHRVSLTMPPRGTKELRKRKVMRLQLTGERWLEYPIVQDRGLPKGDVKRVLVSATKEAGVMKLMTNFQMNVDRPEPKPYNDVMDIDFNVQSEGANVGVTVARFATQSGNYPPLPEGLLRPDEARDTPPVVVFGETGGKLVIPAAWRDDYTRAERERSRRNLLLDGNKATGRIGLRAGLLVWLGEHPGAAKAAGVTVETMKKTGRFDLFKRFVQHVPAGTVTDQALHRRLRKELLAWHLREDLRGLSTVALWAWRDEHIAKHEDTRRNQAVNRRNKMFDLFALYVAKSGCAIGLTPGRMSRRKWVPDVDQEDPIAARERRAIQQYGAPYELERRIRWVCKREGTYIEADEQAGMEDYDD